MCPAQAGRLSKTVGAGFRLNLLPETGREQNLPGVPRAILGGTRNNGPEGPGNRSNVSRGETP